MTDEISLAGLGELLASLIATFVGYTWTTQRLLGRASPASPRGPNARVSPVVPLRRAERHTRASPRGRAAA